MAAPYSAHDLMRELLEMTTQRWIDPERFQRMADKLQLLDIETRIYFITQLRERVRLIPLKLFPHPEIREKMLDALQTAMDSEITKEEESV